jgi:thymidylate synthase (FAD)
MILVKPSFEILSIMAEGHELSLIETAGRVCYKSEDKITPTSSQQFCQRLTKLGHESVIEHSAMTVKFIVDRGVSHELVRHRLCAFSQESTRYCDYRGGVTFIIPPWCEEVDITTPCDPTYVDWFLAMEYAEQTYIALLRNNWTPQQARSVLPNSLKTEIVVTTNFREWRHIFKLRTSKASHPQMREIMIPLLTEVKRRIPVIFDSVTL